MWANGVGFVSESGHRALQYRCRRQQQERWQLFPRTDQAPEACSGWSPAGWWDGMRWNLGKEDDRWLLYKWQSVGTCTSIVRTAGSHQPTVLLWCKVIRFGKVYPEEGLLCRSHLSNHVFAHCSCGNPVGQHMSSILTIKHESSHLRK